MPTVMVSPAGSRIEYTPGASLLDVLRDAGVAVDNPCNGKGTCGKCKVRVASGAVGPATETERRLLSPAETEAGVRLACLVQPEGDVSVEVMHQERKHKVLTTGIIPDFELAPDTTKQVVEVRRPTLEDQTPFEDQVCAQLGLPVAGAGAPDGAGGLGAGAGVPAEVLAEAHLVPGTYTAVMHGRQVVRIEPGDTTGALFGVAIDIGTTTVVCELVDMLTGKALADASQVNAQKAYGLDVLTRITYEQENPESGVANLQQVLVDSLNEMIGKLCREGNVRREQIYEITVGANCTMMHTLLGVDARCIGTAPFAPAFARAKNVAAAQVGIQAAPGARLYCLPHVSAYIGADIVAGAYVCELHKAAGNVLFIDIGTNGEIVLASRGRLLSCSCAAGPALEGMNISAGMRAAEGAVEEVQITPQGNRFAVIGNAEPAGLCGSGILAVMRELLASGIVRKTGAFAKPSQFDEHDYRRSVIVEDGDGKRAFLLADRPERLLVTQADVRQVQLAKGAILSGFVALLGKAGIQMEDLESVVVAGQFGAHLAPGSLTGTGILPSEVEDRIVYAGNTSKTGAYLALVSGEAKRDMERLACSMDYMELGATENYERLFSECMTFPSGRREERG